MIEFVNFTKKQIDENFLTKLAKKVLKRENRSLGHLSITLVGEKRMRSLNKKYRKINKTTDVLSFGEGLNEIVICLSVVERNSKKDRMPFKRELALVLIHGILHILGYSHGENMFDKQNNYLNY